MRSLGLAGATVIGPSGEATFACASSHPASMVSASGTATADRPAALSTLKPSAMLAPEPPQSSGTHDSGKPASDNACQSGAFHLPSLSRLMVWASARSANIFSAVSATMFSLTAFPNFSLRTQMSQGGSAKQSAAFVAGHDEEKLSP